MSPAKRDVAELPLYATYADNHKMYMTKNAIEVEGRCCLVRPDRKPWFAVNENLHQAVYLSLQSTTNLRMCALKRHNATAKPHKTIFKNEKKKRNKLYVVHANFHYLHSKTLFLTASLLWQSVLTDGQICT